MPSLSAILLTLRTLIKVNAVLLILQSQINNRLALATTHTTTLTRTHLGQILIDLSLPLLLLDDKLFFLTCLMYNSEFFVLLVAILI